MSGQVKFLERSWNLLQTRVNYHAKENCTWILRFRIFNSQANISRFTYKISRKNVWNAVILTIDRQAKFLKSFIDSESYLRENQKEEKKKNVKNVLSSFEASLRILENNSICPASAKLAGIKEVCWPITLSMIISPLGKDRKLINNLLPRIVTSSRLKQLEKPSASRSSPSKYKGKRFEPREQGSPLKSSSTPLSTLASQKFQSFHKNHPHRVEAYIEAVPSRSPHCARQ